MCYHIVLADNYPLFRQCVSEILSDIKDLEVVAEADDGQTLLDLLLDGSITPDLIIAADTSMSWLDGFGAMERIKTLHPHAKALVLIAHEDEEYIARALSLGAAGYLLRENACTELIPAIGKIRQGGTYLSSSLTHLTP